MDRTHKDYFCKNCVHGVEERISILWLMINLIMNSGSVCLMCCLISLCSSREKRITKITKPTTKATICKAPGTTNYNKRSIFSIVSSALTKLYPTYINMHGALITCRLGKIRIFPTFVNINLFWVFFFYCDHKCLEPHTLHTGLCKDKNTRDGLDETRGCNILWNLWTLVAVWCELGKDAL